MGKGGGTVIGGQRIICLERNVPSVKRIIKPSLTPNYLLTCCSQTMLPLIWSSHCLWCMSVRVTVAGDCVFTVFDNLPAFSDHHANPDPGLAAPLSARLSHCWGKWLADRLLRQTVKKCVASSPLFYTLLYRETFWGSSDCWTPPSSVYTS